MGTYLLQVDALACNYEDYAQYLFKEKRLQYKRVLAVNPFDL